MNKLYKLLLSILFFVPVISNAQSNYKPGYVLTTKGDTLRGFINVKEWDRNPKSISFKTAAGNNESRTLGVNDITFFKAENAETYQRYIGVLNTDPTNIGNLSTGRDTSTVTDSVFLKVVQKGTNVTLYQYTDDKKDHFFIADNQRGTTFTELIYRIYYDEGKTVHENKYMGQLFNLAQKYDVGSETLKTRIERSAYSYTDLADITRTINKTTEKEDALVTGKKKGTFFFASAGLNISQISSSLSDFDGSSAAYFPRLAVGINILANPNVGKLVLRAEVAYTSNKFKNTKVTNNGNETDTYAFNQNTLSVIPQLLYNFYNTDSFKFYGDVGVSFNISRYGNNLSHIKTGNTDYAYKNQYSLSSTWTAFPIKIGAVLNKKLDINIAYIANATFSQAVGYAIQVKAVQIGINYTF
jgi:hypothetical protein